MNIFGGLEDNAPDSNLTFPGSEPVDAQDVHEDVHEGVHEGVHTDVHPHVYGDADDVHSNDNDNSGVHADSDNGAYLGTGATATGAGAGAGKPRINLVITGIEISKDGPTIWFSVETDQSGFHYPKYQDVRRTYNELKRLSNHLINANPECFIPALPVQTKSFDKLQLVSRVMLERFQKWFDRVLSNPFVAKDKEIVSFVESKTGYVPLIEVKPLASGLSRKYLKQFAAPHDDIDNLREFRPQIKLLYQYSLEAKTAISKLSKERQLLCESFLDSAKGIKLYGEQEDKLTTLTYRFGKAMYATGEGEKVISVVCKSTLGDMFEQLANDCFIIKETLTSRYLMMRNLQEFKNEVDKMQQRTTKMRYNEKLTPASVDAAERDLELSVQKLEKDTNTLRRVNRNLQIEREISLKRIELDIMDSVKRYTLQNIDRERKVLRRWEDFNTAPVTKNENSHVRKFSNSSGILDFNSEDMNSEDLVELDRSIAIKQLLAGSPAR